VIILAETLKTAISKTIVYMLNNDTDSIIIIDFPHVTVSVTPPTIGYIIAILKKCDFPWLERIDETQKIYVTINRT
jgi:hypothetical protein